VGGLCEPSAPPPPRFQHVVSADCLINVEAPDFGHPFLSCKYTEKWMPVIPHFAASFHRVISYLHLMPAHLPEQH